MAVDFCDVVDNVAVAIAMLTYTEHFGDIRSATFLPRCRLIEALGFCCVLLHSLTPLISLSRQMIDHQSFLCMSHRLTWIQCLPPPLRHKKKHLRLSRCLDWLFVYLSGFNNPADCIPVTFKAFLITRQQSHLIFKLNHLYC